MEIVSNIWFYFQGINVNSALLYSGGSIKRILFRGPKRESASKAVIRLPPGLGTERIYFSYRKLHLLSQTSSMHCVVIVHFSIVVYSATGEISLQSAF